MISLFKSLFKSLFFDTKIMYFKRTIYGAPTTFWVLSLFSPLFLVL